MNTKNGLPSGSVSTWWKRLEAADQAEAASRAIPAKYPGVCGRTKQPFTAGTLITHGEYGWETEQGKPDLVSLSPPEIGKDLYFVEIDGDLALTHELPRTVEARLGHLFCWRRLSGSDRESDEDGGYYCLCDPADVGKAEALLGIPPQSRYKGIVTIIGEREIDAVAAI